jgi:light-regulated signal transduction histidine kinase (bacteriophytochrome)
LEDSEQEKKRLEMLQKANLNILEDFHEEREKQANIQKALMNILEDIANLNYVEQLNDELAKEVAERKKAEEEIRERSVLVEAANKELEAFSYSISHDLRAHLRHIDGFSQLLLKKSEGQLDDKNRRYVTAISESVKQLGTMIDELLVYTRIGRTDLNIEWIKTNNIISDIVQKLRFESQNRSISWNIEDLPDVNGDRSQIYLIFQNLISNAVKFTQKKDKAVISIACRQSDSCYVFCVKDNGVGFDMRFYDKLFGLFQRLHTNDEFEGTGIGLANVKRFITKHGGSVWAESALGEGASFYFSLPAPAPVDNKPDELWH